MSRRGHPSDLLSLPSLLIVGITAFGGLLVLRGARSTGRVLAGAFVVTRLDSEERAERIETLEVLERMVLLGGLVGLLFGSIRALAHLSLPHKVGPGIAIALVSLISAVGCNVFFVLPQKHQLLPATDPALRLPCKKALAWVLGVAGLLMLALAGSAYARDYSVGLSVVHILFVVGALVPSAILASDSPVRGPWTSQRLHWYSDALVGCGLLGVSTGVLHVFSVLDQPSLLGPGLAITMTSLLLPLLGAGLLRLKRPTADTTAVAARPGASSLHPIFAGSALFVMAGLAALVVVLSMRYAPGAAH